MKTALPSVFRCFTCALLMFTSGFAIAQTNYTWNDMDRHKQRHSPEEVLRPTIVGGQLAAIEDFPHQVALVDAGTTEGQFCGGTILSENWVITAAHCLFDDDGNPISPTEIDILVGTNDLFGLDGETFPVVQIIRHELYDFFAEQEEHDIALLRLGRAIPLDDPELIAEAVEIVTASDANNGLTAPGTLGEISGWGDLSEDGESPSLLRFAQVPLVSLEVANGPSSYDGSLTNIHLPAGYAQGGVDACQGDSGGPLVISDGEGGVKLAGITSFGVGCGDAGFYGVYTRVSAYENWIATNSGIGQPTGFDDWFTEAFTVVPNPSQGLFEVQYIGGGSPIELLVNSVQGRTLYHTVWEPLQGTSTHLRLDGSNWPKGMYVVRLRQGTRQAVQKVVLR